MNQPSKYLFGSIQIAQCLLMRSGDDDKYGQTLRAILMVFALYSNCAMSMLSLSNSMQFARRKGEVAQGCECTIEI
jgi:hypothetical protein